MRLRASKAYPRSLPKSLMERLALLEPDGARPPRRTTLAGLLGFGAGKRRVGAAFVLGMVASSVAGCAAVAYLVFSRLDRPEPLQPDPIAALLAASPAATVRAAANAGARAEPDQLPFFEMTIRRGERGEALFPVRLVGVDDADDIAILLRGLPAAATLSGGRRKDKRTWVLRLDDLDDLHVILGRGTPDVFDVTIEVISRTGAQLAKTVARVRLADAADTSRTGTRGLAGQPVRASSLDTPFRTEVRQLESAAAAEVRPDPPPEPQRAQRLQRPEGLSALGGPVDGSPAAAPDVRKLWWTVPTPAQTPAWTPFTDALSQH